MRLAKLIAVLTMLTVCVSFAANDKAMTKNTYDKYKVIYKQNIFSKDRLPPSQKQSQGTKQKTTTVLSIYVLRGIAAEAGRSHKFAFVEEQISSQTQTAGIGTEILGGQIKDIQIDHVMFEKDGKTLKVRVGEEFGTTSSTLMVDVAEADSTDASPKEEKTDEASSADEDDLLKKLMERRKSELGT
ncbi:MAG: hypothetical protein KAJ07_08990 [Planctomycetes bacterium]|nr:hypothetical protein [Planctomycetota bacterium]